MSEMAVIITCEHASNKIIRGYVDALLNDPVLGSHEAYDEGAFFYARELSRVLQAPLYAGKYSRLLIDLNRSIGNRHLFSRFTRDCSIAEKDFFIKKIYDPFRRQVLASILERYRKGLTVLHLSCHSFTGTFLGNKRSFDMGILYDTRRLRENEFARALQEGLQKSTSLRVRCNAPYKGSSDGHTTALRRQFSMSRYIGIEIEVNQELIFQQTPWRHVWLPALCREVAGLCGLS